MLLALRYSSSCVGPSPPRATTSKCPDREIRNCASDVGTTSLGIEGGVIRVADESDRVVGQNSA